MPKGTPNDPFLPPPDQMVFFACHQVLFVHCATCGAAPGVYCRLRDGSRIVDRFISTRLGQLVFGFHSARHDIVSLGMCPFCQVAPGQYCVTSTGKPRLPHKSRTT